MKRKNTTNLYDLSCLSKTCNFPIFIMFFCCPHNFTFLFSLYNTNIRLLFIVEGHHCISIFFCPLYVVGDNILENIIPLLFYVKKWQQMRTHSKKKKKLIANFWGSIIGFYFSRCLFYFYSYLNVVDFIKHCRCFCISSYVIYTRR